MVCAPSVGDPLMSTTHRPSRRLFISAPLRVLSDSAYLFNIQSPGLRVMVDNAPAGDAGVMLKVGLHAVFLLDAAGKPANGSLQVSLAP